jgi:hypothetical protein
VTHPRRRVRVTESFFEQLDELLHPDRGPNGEPSATDFLVIDLPSIVDSFGTGFDALPEVIEGVPSPRMLIAVGRLVGRFVVFGLEAADGSIDLNRPRPGSVSLDDQAAAVRLDGLFHRTAQTRVETETLLTSDCGPQPWWRL